MDRKGVSSNNWAKGSKADDINDLKAQIESLMDAVASANTVTPEPEKENLQDMFTFLRATLEKNAADGVNCPETFDHFSTSPRNIVDSGASMCFVNNSSSLNNKVKQYKNCYLETESSHGAQCLVIYKSQRAGIQFSSKL